MALNVEAKFTSINPSQSPGNFVVLINFVRPGPLVYMAPYAEGATPSCDHQVYMTVGELRELGEYIIKLADAWGQEEFSYG